MRILASDWASPGHASETLSPLAPGAYTYMHEMVTLSDVRSGDDLRRIKAGTGGAAGQLDRQAYVSTGGQDAGGLWVAIELPPWLWVVPSHYSLGLLSIQDSMEEEGKRTKKQQVEDTASKQVAVKEVVASNWRLDASPDGSTWYVLRRHTDDQSLDEPFAATHTWPLDVRHLEEPVRFVRIVLEGPLPEVCNLSLSNLLMMTTMFISTQ